MKTWKIATVAVCLVVSFSPVGAQPAAAQPVDCAKVECTNYAAPPAAVVTVPGPAATTNTVTTTGPVTSDTTISVGTLAGQVLTWVVAVFGVPIGSLLTAWLYRLFQQAGVTMTDSMRARLQEMVVNGLNIGVAKATAGMTGKAPVQIKNEAVEHAIDYVQLHGANELKALGFDPSSNIAVDAIKARIETAITDINTPTPKVLDVPTAAPAGTSHIQ